MPPIQLELKNYRCFPDSRPARISVGPGFTAFVGVNNAGKSSLLKFFFEFRSLFGLLSSRSGNLIQALNGSLQGFPGLPGTIRDPLEVFANTNNRDMEISLTVPPDERSPEVSLTLSISRSQRWTAGLRSGGRRVASGQFDFQGESAVVRE